MRKHVILGRIVGVQMMLIGLTACAGQAVHPAQAELSEQGRFIAEQNCARCHAIGESGASPNPAAPPLRTVLQNLDIEVLATDFREHIKIGGEEMPEFDLGPQGTDALMAYLLTIEVLEDD